MRPRQLLLAAPLLALACAAHPPAATFIVPGAAGSDFVASALAAAPLPPDQNLRVQPMLQSEQASVSVAQIRDREPPHIHTRYDLTVLLARGHGTLWLAGVARPMRPGDATFIPKGTPHFFVNEGDEPAVSVVVYAPPFGGPDLAPVP
jgi:quercetin dioxygenase-like cupin family protein